MMDPLSITTGCITFIGAVIGSAKAVRTMTGAREEFDRLIKRITSFESGLKHYQQLLRLRDTAGVTPDPILIELTELIMRAKEILTALDGVWVYDIIKAGSELSEQKVSKSAWLRHKDRIMRLETEVNDEIDHIGQLRDCLAM